MRNLEKRKLTAEDSEILWVFATDDVLPREILAAGHQRAGYDRGYREALALIEELFNADQAELIRRVVEQMQENRG